jgi:plastocyanin
MQETQVAPGLTWRPLLGFAAAANLVVLLTMASALQVTLAVALAAIVVLGLLLLRLGNGLAGVVVLGLLFTDIAFWTFPGALSNALNGESWPHLVFPASLAAISLVGVISAAAILVSRWRPELSDRAAPLVARGAIALFVLILVSGFLTGFRAQRLEVSDLVLETRNMAFSATELVAESGEVTLKLVNRDLWWHTFTIDELNVNLQIAPNGERQITFTAPAGTYTYYCAIPGHEMLGMRGTLVVR